MSSIGNRSLGMGQSVHVVAPVSTWCRLVDLNGDADDNTGTPIANVAAASPFATWAKDVTASAAWATSTRATSARMLLNKGGSRKIQMLVLTGAASEDVLLQIWGFDCVARSGFADSLESNMLYSANNGSDGNNKDTVLGIPTLLTNVFGVPSPAEHVAVTTGSAVCKLSFAGPETRTPYRDSSGTSLYFSQVVEVPCEGVWGVMPTVVVDAPLASDRVVVLGRFL